MTKEERRKMPRNFKHVKTFYDNWGNIDVCEFYRYGNYQGLVSIIRSNDNKIIISDSCYHGVLNTKWEGEENPNSVIVGSIIDAQSFPGRVLAMIPVSGFERVLPSEKRMKDNKFTTF